MAVKVYKNSHLMGHANVEGLSFPETAIMYELKRLHSELVRKVNRDGGVTTGPARIVFTVEQDVIVPDEENTRG